MQDTYTDENGIERAECCDLPADECECTCPLGVCGQHISDCTCEECICGYEKQDCNCDD